jgi:hypothetical protein
MRSRKPFIDRGWHWDVATLSWTNSLFPGQTFRDNEVERKQALLEAIARIGLVHRLGRIGCSEEAQC